MPKIKELTIAEAEHIAGVRLDRRRKYTANDDGSADEHSNQRTNMKIIDATPPKGFPAQVVIMDREFAKLHPSKAFYLRVTKNCFNVDSISLDDAITPIGARELAVAKGYEPTHWMDATDCVLARF